MLLSRLCHGGVRGLVWVLAATLVVPVAWAQAPQPAGGQGAETSTVQAVPAEPVPPFEYRLGQTRRPDAEAYWAARGLQVLGAGHLALGTGSGKDNNSQAFDREVDLIDVSGVDIEGLTVARFGFFKGVLYSIQIQLRHLLNPPPMNLKLSDEQLDALERRLRERHGPPKEQHRTNLAPGKGPDLLIWHRGPHRLIYSRSLMGAHLSLVDPAIQAEVRRHTKEACKEFNTKGRIVCW